MKRRPPTRAPEPLPDRIAQLIGLPDLSGGALCFLAMVMVAWADGAVEPGERESIRQEARRARLKPRMRERLEALLSSSPGPYLEHRVITLIRLAKGRMTPEQAKKFTDELTRCAQAVDHTRFPLLRRLFDSASPTTQGVQRVRGALSRPLAPEVEELLSRLLVSRETIAAPRPGTALMPRQLSAMHLEGDTFTQVRALVFDAGRGHPAATFTCLESFTFGADLAEQTVAHVFQELAGRPEIERWTELYLRTCGQAPAPSEALAGQLTARLAAGLTGPLHRVSLAEMSDLEDRLARNHGWVGWMAGSFRELRVDADEVRRDAAPGNFACPRSALLPPRVVRQRIAHVDGLIFRVLDLRSDIGERLSLASPEPAPDAPPTGDFTRWLCHFLPLIQDPLSVPLFGYESLDEARDLEPPWLTHPPPESEHPAPTAAAHTWKLDLRTGFPDDLTAQPPEPLPAGCALVVTPWVWLRTAWALGVDPDPVRA